MSKDMLSIYCPMCGAPANFDIINQIYRCEYCGGEVAVEDIAQNKKEQQETISKRIQESAEDFALEKVTCSGCGASLIFEEKEALAKCAFCGRSLVREKYAAAEDAPQSIIPFALTKEEAQQRLAEWCSQNSQKEEAKLLKKHLSSLEGYYLPYRLIQGPVKTSVKAQKAECSFEAQGYLYNGFVDCSNQIDNYILDAMEPYDLADLKEFDFAYVAGHRVKTSDLTEEKSVKRIAAETSENYRGKMEKIWKTKSLHLLSQVNPALNIPVLLPVYYISQGDLVAAVNGQTGKVSVRALKESTYIDIPWWIKGLAVLLLALGGTYLALSLGMKGPDSSSSALLITGMLSIFYLIVFACMFQPTDRRHKMLVRYRNIFTSGEASFRRCRGKLVLRDEVLERELSEPVFMRDLGGKPAKVMYRFRSFPQIAKMAVISLTVIFLPIIFALLLNGFDFAGLDFSGSAVWLCITVPVVPIYFIIFGIRSLYDNPWIYIYAEDGALKRYKDPALSAKTIPALLKSLLKPKRLIIALVILGIFCIMVYATAFGFPE